MFRNFFQKYSFGFLIVGLVLNFAGSGILIFGALPSDETINQISGTYYKSNQFLKESLEENRCLAKMGLVLVSLGFLLGIAGAIGGRFEIKRVGNRSQPMGAKTTSKSLSEFTFDQCEKNGAVNKFGHEFYENFINLSDETMILIIKHILKANAAEINKMLFERKLQALEFDKELYRLIRSSLALMSMGILCLQEDGSVGCYKPDGPTPSRTIREKLDQKIEMALQFIPQAMIEIMQP
ncbi:MAG: hypothetical protein Q7T03_02165 [Deltaproteobacteria bacterium]|nr:hypothetical protein [Deltaproteobacteria bacterium]